MEVASANLCPPWLNCEEFVVHLSMRVSIVGLCVLSVVINDYGECFAVQSFNFRDLDQNRFRDRRRECNLGHTHTHTRTRTHTYMHVKRKIEFLSYFRACVLSHKMRFE